MISYYDGLITDILPTNLVLDNRVKALALALRDLLRMMDDYAKKVALQGGEINAPDEALDLMAAELRTQHYYSTSLDSETKKELIARTPEWHMKAGTPEAIEELLKVLFGEGKVIEWYEYGGRPYHFKVKINGIMRPGMFDDFENLIRKIKNARSKLDGVEVERSGNVCEYVAGCGFNVRHLPAIRMDWQRKPHTTMLAEYAGVAVAGVKILPMIGGD